MKVNDVREFFEFLQGDPPDGMKIGKRHQPVLTAKKAMTVIWYLQEYLDVFPSGIRQCHSCGELFDSNSEGIYWESKRRDYCGACDWQVPKNYDRGKR